MAMAHGKSGSIQWAGTGMETSTILSWSLETSADVADGTNIASTADWKEYLAGFKGWTATVEANYNATDPTNVLGTWLGGEAAKLELFMTGTVNIYGNAILTGFTLSVDKDDVVKASYSFQGTGALTYSATDTA
jgi:predicted secreted protein